MKLRVDNRESKLLALIDNTFDNGSIDKPIIQCEPLPLGDVILSNADDSDYIIFERKTLSDLASSILDGRYQEQSQRLLGCGLASHNIVYIIEGSFSTYRARGIKPDALWAAIVALSFKKGFSVMRTNSTLETAEYIYHVFRKSIEFAKSNSNGITNVEDIADKHVASLSKVKRDNITVQNGQQLMLACIPGVSTKAANAILEEYTSVGNLITALQDDPNCVSGICIKCENGRLRRIPRSAVINLQAYLLYERQSSTIKINTE